MHVIDAVLLPPRITVVDVVVNSPDHETLEAAVIAAELAETLSGDGPFTVFAPTDAAFAALPEGTVEALLQDPTGDLATILTYHVLGAKVLSTDLSNGQVAETLQSESITVTIDGNNVFINNAQVTVADIETDNGVVHVIDAVLLPPSITSSVDLVQDELIASVFPNPFNNELRISFKFNPTSTMNVRLTNVNGKVVNQWNVNDQSVVINTNDLPQGVYYLSSIYEGSMQVQKLVKN